MKALTVLQPYASWIMAADSPHRKYLEHRSWRPPEDLIGQRLAIHAGARPHPHMRRLDIRLAAESATEWAYTETGWPTGVVLGTVRLVRVSPVGELVRWPYSPSDLLSMCHPTDGYAWHLDDPHLFPRPVEAKGRQRLWDWDPPDTSECHGAMRKVCVDGAFSTSTCENEKHAAEAVEIASRRLGGADT